MDYCSRYMSGSLPLKGRDLRKLADPLHGELKCKKHATIDLDAFLNPRHNVPTLVSPKFANEPDRPRQITSQVTRLRPAPPAKSRCSCDPRPKSRSRENCGRDTSLRRRDVSNSMLVDRCRPVGEKVRPLREANDRLNKSYANPRPQVRTQDRASSGQPRRGRVRDENCVTKQWQEKFAVPNAEKLPERHDNNQAGFADPAMFYYRNDVLLRKEINIDVPSHNLNKTSADIIPREEAWGPSTTKASAGECCGRRKSTGKPESKDRAMRIELELRQQKSTMNRRRFEELFDEIILAEPCYGRALRLIKDMYDGRVAQLNDRVARHDAKVRECKELMERERKMRDEAERKYDLAKRETEKQLLYIESQKSIIQDLKTRLERTPTISPPAATMDCGGLSQSQSNNDSKYATAEFPHVCDRLDKVLVPPLDLSKLRRPRKSAKPAGSEDVGGGSTGTNSNVCVPTNDNRVSAGMRRGEQGQRCSSKNRKEKDKEYKDEFDVLLEEFS